mgnify:CR=1 FL=1|jgi:hypothetical protein
MLKGSLETPPELLQSEKYCLCQSPDDGRLMVQCEECRDWFHPSCAKFTVGQVKRFRTKSTTLLTCAGHDPNRFALYKRSPLYLEGYQVFRGAVRPTKGLLERAGKAHSRALPIFNDNADFKTDLLRRQTPIELDVVRELPGFADLEARVLAPGPREWNALISLPGCQRQAAHADYDNIGTVSATNPLVAHGCLVAIESGTRLDVWPGAHHFVHEPGTPVKYPISRLTLELDVGDVVVFRCDCIHAGSAYSKANVRLHCYCDTEEMLHAKNRTNRHDNLLVDGILTDA